jgi:hypothetical protein
MRLVRTLVADCGAPGGQQRQRRAGDGGEDALFHSDSEGMAKGCVGWRCGCKVVCEGDDDEGGWRWCASEVVVGRAAGTALRSPFEGSWTGAPAAGSRQATGGRELLHPAGAAHLHPLSNAGSTVM